MEASAREVMVADTAPTRSYDPEEANNSRRSGAGNSFELQAGILEEDEDKRMPLPKDTMGTRFNMRTLMVYMGPGWLMSLAYIDPGNLESDLQAGAYTGYQLIWVLFFSTVFGLILQILAARLGAVTGLNLAQMCRVQYSKTMSRLLCAMTEVAIIGSDIQEILGSATAFNILFGWPLWVGTVLTTMDTFTLLMLDRAGSPRPLEILITSLILIMSVCFMMNFFVVAPQPAKIIGGFLPMAKSYAVLQMVGTVGAVIMPHNIYLHSALVQSRRLNRDDSDHVRQANKYFAVDSGIALFVSFVINLALQTSFAEGFFVEKCAENPTATLGCYPGAAGPSDSCAISPAEGGCSCVTSTGRSGYCSELGLDTGGTALEQLLHGNAYAAKMVFALGILAAGQASTMTGAFAGQYVLNGFLEWNIPIWKRSLITRSVALGPAMAVALLQSSSSDSDLSNKINEFLNILQSVQLPFALLPVLHFTSREDIMGDFALKKRWKLLCWVLALLIIGINFYLVSTELAGKSAGVVAMAAVAGVGYCALILAVIRKDLVEFVNFLTGCCGLRAA